MTSTCHVCGHDLPPEAASELVYCSHCGAPQLQLSEDLRVGTAEQSGEPPHVDEPLTPAEPRRHAARPEAIDWRAALHLAFISAGVTAAITLLALPLPSLGLLAGLWFVASPVAMIGFYGSRRPHSRITPKFGARFGLIVGLFNLLALVVLKVGQFDVLRHAGAMGPFDAVWGAAMANAVHQAAAMGKDTSVLGELSRPEFRVGWVMASFAMFSGILLALTSAGGAFAALVRFRPTTAGPGR